MKKIKNEWAICDFADACLNTVRVIIALVFFGFLVSVMILGLNDVGEWVDDAVNFEELDQDIVYSGSGVGRVEVVEVPIYTAGAEVTEKVAELSEKPTIEIYKEGTSPVPAWYQPTEKMSVEWVEETPKKDIASPDAFWNEKLYDSRGASAERWEIEEAIRELMLEAGGESDADIREHAAVYCKRLLYTQIVGGYDDWGTTLHEVVYSHGFLETYPYIWEERANPTDHVREIWWDVWNNGYDTDFRVQNFRKDWYHSLKWSIPAYQIGHTCYSINIYQDFSMFE